MNNKSCKMRAKKKYKNGGKVTGAVTTRKYKGTKEQQKIKKLMREYEGNLDDNVEIGASRRSKAAKTFGAGYGDMRKPTKAEQLAYKKANPTHNYRTMRMSPGERYNVYVSQDSAPRTDEMPTKHLKKVRTTAADKSLKKPGKSVAAGLSPSKKRRRR